MQPQEFDETYRVLIVSPEVVPFAKTGGLADVAGSLPKALAMHGNDVRVVLPRYRGIEPERTVGDFPVMVGDRKETAILREGSIMARLNEEEKRVPVYFIDNYHYFDRDNIYGYYDEAERYAFFSKAVLAMLRFLNWRPEIIHCNDWQTGPIPALLRQWEQADSFYSDIATVYTIHNLRYQGNFHPSTIHLLGLGQEYLTPERMEFYGELSYMKAGIVYADMVSTVSRTYSEEIQTPEFGERMEGVLRSRAEDLYGIVNGINYHEFNPATDQRIYQRYTDPEGKRANKYGLQGEMGLPRKDVPLFGLISRLVDQKGLDLIAQISDELMGHDLQVVVLGTGDPHYEDMFRTLRERYPDKVGVHIGFNAALAQKIYAGADLFLMPSRYEPCGLGQLISLRYGTIPIVRETGGLKDTITDYDPETRHGNGFSFRDYDSSAFLSAIRRSLAVYHNEPVWRELVENAMNCDFSWNRSATEYMGLYGAALRKVHRILTA
ncbi:MAG TPA: glycogen synthase GlgA [Bacillota bacterium]|jgi:starch synthase|nr:glycogen synthase GlgA [Bacillota bacterium]